MSSIIYLTDVASEKGSYPIGLSITGFEKEAVTPNTVNWRLTDKSEEKNIINNRSNESATPAAVTWIILQADDLVKTGPNAKRRITFKGTFNSEIDGVPKLNNDYTVEGEFSVEDLQNIPFP